MSDLPVARLGALDAMVRQLGVPIHGVHFADLTQTQAVIQYAAEATPAQQSQGAAVLSAFDWSQAAQDAWELPRRQAVIGTQTIRRTTANQAITGTTLVDVAGLAFELAPNTHYKFRFVGGYTSALSTTGLSLAVNGPASPVWVSFAAQIALTGTTAAYGIGSAYNTPSTAPTSGAATPLPFTVEGTISTGAAGGTFTLRAASEVAGSTVTILRGSIGELAAAA